MSRYLALVTLVHLTFAFFALRASELIDAGQLGDRGVIFESPGTERNNIADARGIGDFDGDGFDDIVVLFREPALGPDAPPRRAAALVHGGPLWSGRQLLGSDLAGTAIFRPSSLTPDGGFHYPETIGDIGDQNGDGLADFALQYETYRLEPAHGRGVAFVFHGTAGLRGDHAPEEIGDSLSGIVIFSSDPSHLSVGRAMANLGDFNGDGRSDLAVSATSAANPRGESNAGAVFVLFGSEDLPPRVDLAEVGRSLPGLRIYGAAWEHHLIGFVGNLGEFIRRVDDFDGDGLSDMLVTARELQPRTVYLIRGRPDHPAVIDFSESEDVEGVTRFRGPLDSRYFGSRYQAADAGDLNGDGLSDILLAASLDGGFLGENSVARVFYGRADFPPEVSFIEAPEELATTFQPRGHADGFGNSVAAAGDLNSDGTPDLLIGASRARGGAGELYAIFGRRDLGTVVRLADGFEGLLLRGEDANNSFGRQATSAGDFNGDGAIDILVSAPHATGTGEPGRVYVVYGAGAGDLPLRLLGIEPADGPRRGGSEVVLRGSGFRGAPLVTFGGRVATVVAVESASRVRVELPPSEQPGLVDVTITVDGETATLPEGFEYTENVTRVRLAELEERGFALEGEARALFGRSVAFGDLTGDGVDELVASGSREGRMVVTIVRGGSDLPPRAAAFDASPGLTLITSLDPTVTRAGEVAVPGDLNGDGRGDLLISAGAGRGFLVLGREHLPDEMVIEDELFLFRAVRLVVDDGFGGSLRFAGTGDLTGDGLDDFAVAFVRSAPFAGEPRDAGEVLFVSGRANWPEDVDLDAPSWRHSRLVGSRPGQTLGHQITSVGDANGDGLADLLVSALSTDAAGAAVGHAYLLYGARDLPAESDADSFVDAGGGVRIAVDLDEPEDLHIGAAGDVDADGFADMIISASRSGDEFEGVTLLVRGGRDLPAAIRVSTSRDVADGRTRVFGEGPQTFSGAAVTAGDYNADGYDDFLVRATNLLESPSLESAFGKAFLVYGGATPPGTIELGSLRDRGLTIEGRPPGRMSLPAKAIGDLNGDGRPDFALLESVLVPSGAEVVELDTLYVIYGLASEREFVRGNANSDAGVDIADAVFILAHLFTGGARPRCDDAADVDDDGAIRITDAIYLFAHLFGGGPEPPPPFAVRGEDPTEDALDCRNS